MTASPATGQQQTAYEQCLNAMIEDPAADHLKHGFNYLRTLRDRRSDEYDAEDRHITLEELHGRKVQRIRDYHRGKRGSETYIPELVEKYQRESSDAFLEGRKNEYETSLRKALGDKGISLSDEEFTQLSKEILNRIARAWNIRDRYRPGNGVNGNNGQAR